MSELNFGALQDLGLTVNSAAAKKNDELGQEDFLELMVAQLKNQDPMKPMENGDFLGQIAQFGTVNGIQGLQSSFAELAASMQSNQALQASGLVGHSVLAPASFGQMTAENGMSGTLNLGASAADVTVSIFDASGQLVRRIPMGNQQAGLVPFTWDGSSESGEPVLPGTYEVRAEANSGGSTYSLETWIEAEVESVTFNGPGGGLVLQLAGLGEMDFSEVKQVR